MSWSCQYDEKSLVMNQWGSFINVIISEAQYLCPLSLYLCYSSLIIWLVVIAELYMSPHHLLLELFKITDPSHGWQGNCVNTNFPTTIKLRLTNLLNTHWLAGWYWPHNWAAGCWAMPALTPDNASKMHFDYVCISILRCCIWYSFQRKYQVKTFKLSTNNIIWKTLLIHPSTL